MTTDELRARMKRVVGIGPRLVAGPRPVPAAVDPALTRAESAHDWINDKRAQALDDQITEMRAIAHAKALESRLTHAETTFWLGFGAALDDLRTLLTAWRDNRTPTPQEKGPTA